MAWFGKLTGLGLVVFAGLLTGCVSAPPPRPVEHADINAYAGKWYEIARIPHLYEYNCVASTYQFFGERGSDMRVVHRCHQDETFGWMREDVGTVHAKDSSNAKLSLNMGLAGGDFWVLALNDDPTTGYAVMGTPDRHSVMILSRKPVLTSDVDEKLFRLIDDMGYDVGRVRRTPQPMGL